MRKLTHEEILERQQNMKGQPRLPFSVVLNDIRSAHNVGSIFRTCDGVGVGHLWLCGITAYPPDPQIAKTALGAQTAVPWSHTRDILSVVRQLKQEGYELLLLEQTDQSEDYRTYVPKGPVALIVGNEVEGVTEEVTRLCDRAVEIDMAGEKNSLNVAVALGILAYHVRGQLIGQKG